MSELTSDEDMPWVYMHREEKTEFQNAGCGFEAFYLTEKPGHKAKTKSEIVRHLDGSQMERAAKIICETCGGHIPYPQGDQIVARDLS